MNRILAGGFLVLFLVFVIFIFSGKNTPDISYVMDVETGLCFAVLRVSISEVPCTDKVMSEIFSVGGK